MSMPEKYMAENGNPGQWVNGYPAREDIEKDLNRSALYLCESSDGTEGVFMFETGEEPNYRRIENGCWLNEKAYGFLHRIGLLQGERRGVLLFVYSGVWPGAATCGRYPQG